MNNEIEIINPLPTCKRLWRLDDFHMVGIRKIRSRCFNERIRSFFVKVEASVWYIFFVNLKNFFFQIEFNSTFFQEIHAQDIFIHNVSNKNLMRESLSFILSFYEYFILNRSFSASFCPYSIKFTNRILIIPLYKKRPHDVTTFTGVYCPLA